MKHYPAYCTQLLQEIQPDVIVSFNPGTSSMLLCVLDTKIPVITMSHGDPADYFGFYPDTSVEAVRKSTINQVLLPSFAEHLKSHLPECKTVVIGNAIPQYVEFADLETDKDVYKIIFVGRLNHNHKRPHILIEAFAKIAAEFPNWVCELWGAQDSKTYYVRLKTVIKEKGLQDRCFLKGTTKDVASVLRTGDIFAFPSAYEGFGMALGEGMSMGLPAVGFKSTTAVNEIIKDGETGILCDDGVDAFAKALYKLMNNNNLRKIMGKNARLSMKEYAPEMIWNKWESLLLETIRDR